MSERSKALREAAQLVGSRAVPHRVAMADIEEADPELEGKGNGEEHDLHRFVAEALEEAAAHLRAIAIISETTP